MNLSYLSRTKRPKKMILNVVQGIRFKIEFVSRAFVMKEDKNVIILLILSSILCITSFNLQLRPRGERI